MRLLIIDNYDSFTYNLVQMIEQCGVTDFKICKNDQVSAEDTMLYDKILLSPGPGLPAEAGNLLPIIKACAVKKDILGICLGHQAITESFGAKLFQLPHPLHGIVSEATITGDPVLFKNLPQKIKIGRYHSWAVSDKDFPDCLEITSLSDDGIIMSIKHKTLALRGIQFHPESIMTPQGKTIIRNWLRITTFE